MTLPEMRGGTVRDLEHALLRDDFVLARSSGSHQHPDGRRLIVAFHPLGDAFKSGTLCALLKHASGSDDDVLRPDLVRRKSARPEDGREAT